MAQGTNATPLIAIDAVVLDTETTGLDPNKARVVEVAAVRIVRGRLDPGQTFRALVNPGAPIPEASTLIHGIDDAAVAEAPTFAAVWPDLVAFIAGDLVIGHTLGFDLAVMKRECERAKLAWTKPRSLDTRLLAQTAEARLAGYTLDALASWLEVEITDRHSALADATATAKVFLALLPRLRDKGVRTLAEAEQASRGHLVALDGEHGAGWEEAVSAPERAETERTLSRIDSYPYRHRISAIMSSPPHFISPDATLSDSLAEMMRLKSSSLYIAGGGQHAMPRPSDTGILTERDVLRVIASRGADALTMRVADAASFPLATLPADAFVYRAIGRMGRLRVRHLGVTNDEGRVCGALSARDLLRLRAEEAVELGDEIDAAADAPALAAAWAKIAQVATSLVAEDVSGRDVAAVISRELAATTRQAAVIAGERMRIDGHGDPPCPYAVAVLGSAGRGESLLAMDQDNALVFAEGEPDGPEDRWFAQLAAHVADILNEVGVPYCKGGVMARNPQWRGSVATWKTRIDEWVRRSRPQDLLSVDIFFDMRGVFGEVALASELWRSAFAAARGNLGFAKLLAEASGTVESGLTLFGGFRTVAGRIDLKKSGLFGVVSAARVLAIRHQVVERSTPARIAGLRAIGIGGERNLEALAEAQGTFLDLILRQQLADIHAGRPPSNAVEPKSLSRAERERLRAALEAVTAIDDLVRDLLFAGPQ